MKKLIIVLMFLCSISPNVWGNENKNTFIDSVEILQIYTYENLSLGLNVAPIESLFTQCQTDSIERTPYGIMQSSSNENICNTDVYEKQNLFIGIQISKKDSRNRFTVSLQSGFNFGIQNEKKEDGTQRIRVHANIKGNYEWWEFKGEYKGVFHFISPGDSPYSYGKNDAFVENYRRTFTNSENEGLILNKDIYIGIEVSF